MRGEEAEGASRRAPGPCDGSRPCPHLPRVLHGPLKGQAEHLRGGQHRACCTSPPKSPAPVPAAPLHLLLCPRQLDLSPAPVPGRRLPPTAPPTPFSALSPQSATRGPMTMSLSGEQGRAHSQTLSRNSVFIGSDTPEAGPGREAPAGGPRHLLWPCPAAAPAVMPSGGWGSGSLACLRHGGGQGWGGESRGQGAAELPPGRWRDPGCRLTA